MDRVLGVINLMNENPFLKELTNNRCLASVPFAGRYRLIDFTLSNFVHANIGQVAVFTKDKYRSIMDHLGSGKEWDLDRNVGGLYVLPPINPDEKVKGDIQQFHDHIEFFNRTAAKNVIITPGHHVCKIDFNEVITQHRQSNADITVVYKKYQGDPVLKPVYHKCLVDTDQRVEDIELYTSPRCGEAVAIETFVIDKDLLVSLISQCMDNQEYDFLKDIVKANLHRLNVKGYEFEGDMPFIHSIDSYYSSNMAFLNPEILHSFFYSNWDVYTKIKHEAPVRYGLNANVSNSLIANGCTVEGDVENSIIFRGVHVHKGAVVRNSIIMQKGEIEEGAYVENIVADKQVKIKQHSVVVGYDQPKVLKKAETI